MTTISLKISQALDQRLRHVARQRHTSRSAILREAAERYVVESVESPESCLALSADLIGCVDGPEDLSHNKAHLRGFGQ
ncbi:MAG: ribbon-helix-helix protein, CopG family [Lentisphaeria bacterium]|nr:ribbon-helix-helix protein, CopG family [Lentisphaeria bacterium]